MPMVAAAAQSVDDKRYMATATLMSLPSAGRTMHLLVVLTIFAVVSLCAARAYNWVRIFWTFRNYPRTDGTGRVKGGLGRSEKASLLQMLQGGSEPGLFSLSHPKCRVVRAMEGLVGGTGCFYYRMLWFQALVITDPSIVSEVLVQNNLQKSSGEYESLTEMMSPGGRQPDLVTTKGGPTDWVWKMVRKGCAPAFSHNCVREGVGRVAPVIDRMIELLHQHADTPFDVTYAFMCEAVEGFGAFGFNHAFHAIEGIAPGKGCKLLEHLIGANREVGMRVIKPFRKLFKNWDKEAIKGQAFIDAYQADTREVLNVIKARGPPADDDKTVAAQLMRLRDPKTGQPLSDDLLHAQIAIFFWAGYETSGNAMAWAVFLISQHPQVEATIVEELAALGLVATPEKPHPRPPTFDDFASMKMLGAAVKEALRLLPPTWVVPVRQAHADMWLDKGRIFVPKGTVLWTPILAMHNSSAHWPDHDKFLPERFLQPNTEFVPSKHPGAAPVRKFIPFSNGPRDCIGQSFARANYMYTLSRLYGHFSFKLTHEGGAPAVMASLKYGSILSSREGVWMQAQPRVKGPPAPRPAPSKPPKAQDKGMYNSKAETMAEDATPALGEVNGGVWQKRMPSLPVDLGQLLKETPRADS